jgi:hypothetical protein
LNDERREERDQLREQYRGEQLDLKLQQLNSNIEERKQEIKNRLAELSGEFWVRRTLPKQSTKELLDLNNLSLCSFP